MTVTLIFPTGIMLNDHRLDKSLPVDACADDVKALFEETLTECRYIDRSYPLPSTAGWVKYGKEHDEISAMRERDVYRLIPEVLDKPSGRTGKRPAKQGEITVPVTASSDELVAAFNAAFRIIEDERPN